MKFGIICSGIMLVIICCSRIQMLSAENVSENRIVAVVNGLPILKSELDRHVTREISLRKIRNPQAAVSQADIVKLRREILDGMILHQLLKSEAIRDRISVSTPELDEEMKIEKSQFRNEQEFLSYLYQQGMDMDSFRENIENRLLRRKVIRKLAGSENKVTETMMKDYYEKNIDRFHIPETRDLQELTLFFNKKLSTADKQKTKELMRNILLEMKSGKDFNRLKEKYHSAQFPISANILHNVERGKLLEELDEELFRLKQGEIGSIHENTTGLHIIKCLKIYPAHIKSYESSMYEIRERLHYLIFGAQEQQLVHELRKNAHIEIFE